MNLIENLEKRKLITPPKWLNHSIGYLVTGGSVAYGVSKDSSDRDILGWCIPPKEHIFYSGEIYGFGKQKQRFEQYLQHGIKDIDKGCNYDLTCFSISKFFDLSMAGNPNVLELSYVPHDCVLFCTEMGNLVRENRKLFLHKGTWQKHKGYAFSSLHKMSNRNKRLEFVKEIETKYGVELTHQNTSEEEYNRVNNEFYEESDLIDIPTKDLIECRQILGSSRNQKILNEGQDFDRKFACHTVRLLLQVEQILSEGDMDLRRNSDHLKAIRNGEVSEEEIRKWFTLKETELEKLYHESKLPWGPDEAKIKDLLLKCLESHYGSLDKCVERVDKYEVAISNIKEILEKL